MNQDSKLKQTFKLKETLSTQVDTFKKEMVTEWQKQSNLILEKLEVQELRMQEIEIRHLDILAFQKKFTEFQIKFAETLNVMENFKDLPKIVERTIPMLTHF